MRSTPTSTHDHARPKDRLRLDPYVVQGTTWTREELLKARGMKVTHARRPASTRHRAA